MIALLVVVALLAALGWAASRWGADTREPGEWRIPHRPSGYPAAGSCAAGSRAAGSRA